VKISGRASRPLIQIYVDWEDGGITIDGCATLTRKLLDLFDLQERFAPDYRLEVSSPGLDIPLKEAWQFRKNIGKTIRWQDDAGEKEGRILDVSADGAITIESKNETVSLLVIQLAGAKLVLFPNSKRKTGRRKNEARSR